MADDTISVSGQHLCLGRRSKTLPDIKGSLSAVRSKKEIIDDLIANRPPSKVHILKWPPDHLTRPSNVEHRGRQKSPLRPQIDTLPRYKWGAQEIEHLVREKLKLGLESIRQLFNAGSDPDSAIMSRENFPKIIYHLCGYFSQKQIDDFLQRVGLAERQCISFDDFLSIFDDHEAVKAQWNQPDQRARAVQPRFQPPREASLLRDDRGTAFHRQLTAAFAVEQLKAKLYEQKLKVEDLFPPSCLTPRGLILPPQLREAFSSVGLDLDSKEFWALWKRYDLENAGAITKETLFKIWGLDQNGRVKPKDIMPTELRPQMRVATASSIALEDLSVPAECRPNGPCVENGDSILNIPKSQMKIRSKEVLDMIRTRLDKPFADFNKNFEQYDTINSGQLSTDTIRRVFLDNKINCSIDDVENLLIRQCISFDKNGVYYSQIVQLLVERSEEHRNLLLSRLSNPEIECECPSTEEDLEEKIVSFLTSEFASIIKPLKVEDINENGIISVKSLHRQLEKLLPISASDMECLSALVLRKPSDECCDYRHFLRLLLIRKKSNSGQNSGSSRPSSFQSATRELSVFDKKPKSRRASGARKSVSARNLNLVKEEQEEYDQIPDIDSLPLSALEKVMTEVSKNKIHSLQKAFLLLCKNGKRSMTKSELAKVLVKIGIPLNDSEIEKVWATLPLEADSDEVLVTSLITRFTPGYPLNSQRSSVVGATRLAPISDEELVARAKQKIAIQRKIRQNKQRAQKQPKVENTQVIGADECAAERERVRALMLKIKPQMCGNVARIKEYFLRKDHHGRSHVDYEFTKNLLMHFQLPLTRNELEFLVKAFDINNDGNFHYLRFLELYIPAIAPPRGHEPPPPVDAESIVHAVRSRVLSKWKSLRRAFAKFDINRDGFLQPSEFRQVLIQHGIQLDEEQFYHLMTEIDRNMDGKLSYEEFLKYFLV